MDEIVETMDWNTERRDRMQKISTEGNVRLMCESLVPEAYTVSC